MLLLDVHRLDEANEQTMLYQNEMKAHKQNAVQLEKIIGKMRLEGSQAKSSSGQCTVNLIMIFHLIFCFVRNWWLTCRFPGVIKMS